MKLETLLSVDEETVNSVMQTFGKLREPRYGKYSTLHPSHSEPPTEEETARTKEIINRFVQLGVMEWVGEATDDELDEVLREAHAVGDTIMSSLWLHARDMRQRPGVVDDPSLVAAEHYFVGYWTGPVLVHLYDVGKWLALPVTNKPKSVPMLWIRAWALQGAANAP